MTATATDNPHPIRYADGPTRQRLEPLMPPDPSADGWTQVKQSDTRTVYRGQVDGQNAYLKIYHGRSVSHRLRRLLGRCDAAREMHFGQYLAAHGVRTAPVLAAGGPRGARWLLTAAVEPAEPLDAWHAQQLAEDSPASRKRLRHVTLALARLIGQMHAAGVAHWDLHSGNILVRTDTDKPSLVLMDLHRMGQCRLLSRRTRARNLAQLFTDRRHLTSRTQRLRFLHEYLRASGAGGSVRGWEWLIRVYAARHARKLNAQRDRRIGGRNRYFTPIRLPGGWRGHAIKASKRCLAGSQAATCVFGREDWRELVSDVDALFTGDDAEVVKDTKSSKIVRRTLRIGGKDVRAYVKRPGKLKWWKLLLSPFRPSRPVRAFRLGHQLLTRRIPTALPLVAIERRVGPFLVDSLLIAEAVEAPHLYDFMQTWLSVPPRNGTVLTEPQQRQLAQEVLWQLGRMLQNLHDNFFTHRDLKATNMRVRWSPGEKPEIVLVDLDGLKQVRFITRPRKFRGLMRLNVSLLQCPVVNHAGRLRMLMGYLRRPGSGKIHYKPYWRVLEAWSARKLRQQLRTRRRKQIAVRRPT